MLFPIKFYNAETVTVQKMVPTQNELGEVIEDWQDIDTLEAEIWPLNSSVTKYGNAVRGEMGVTEKSTHKAFSSGAFQSNTRLITPYGTFLVGYVQNWHGFYTAILELITA